MRRMSVAGRWYPSGAAALAAEVDSYISRADVPVLREGVRAVIAPHAGLMYSGPVAAHAYKSLQRDAWGSTLRTSPCAAILVGPSHFVDFGGVSIWPTGAWATPYGAVAIEETLAAALCRAAPVIVEEPAAHAREHSLEMQLPFVARLLPGVPIVPLVMGRQTRETAFGLGEAIAATVADWPGDVLLVASSDLSHYEDARTAAAMDAVVARHVEAVNAAGLMAALEREPRHACGGGPMVSVLHAARSLGATTGRVLHYADSGDVSGDRSSVVGYLAAVIC